MFRCCSLYSGSSGNCFFVQSDETKLLIDAGVSCKKIETSLTSFNINLNEVDAILVTHEHIDHTKSLGVLSKKYNIPIYANEKTWNSLPKIKDQINSNNLRLFNTNEYFNINDLKIFPFPTPHDAAEPCGFNIYKDNKKISVATDLGHINTNIINNLKKSSLIMLEANYDSNVLKYSSYPYLLKKRIASPNGHLENCITGQTIASLIDSGLKDVLLIHLSKENNFPELAYQTVLEELKKNNCLENSISLTVAPRDYPSNFFNVS